MTRSAEGRRAERPCSRIRIPALWTAESKDARQPVCSLDRASFEDARQVLESEHAKDVLLRLCGHGLARVASPDPARIKFEPFPLGDAAQIPLKLRRARPLCEVHRNWSVGAAAGQRRITKD